MGDFPRLLDSRRAKQSKTMNSKMLILLFVGAVLLGWAEAGCNQDGCCYCHKEQGYVLQDGLYQEDCDYGYYCRCNHGPRIGYYGECVRRGTGPVIQAVNPNNAGGLKDY